MGMAWAGLMCSVQTADFLWFILHCECEELAMMGVAWTGLMCSVQIAFSGSFCTVNGSRWQ